MEILSFLAPFFAKYFAFFTFFPLALAAFGNKNDSEKNDSEPSDSEPSDDDRADSELLADFRFNINELMQDRSVDRDALKSRIGRLEERIASGEENVEEPLTQDYLTLAIESQDEEDFDEALEYYLRAIRTLKQAIAKRPSSERTRMLGLARLSYAVMLNDIGKWAEALVEYRNAAEAMAQLAESGDLEARLDLAGIHLNVATIHFELGDTTGDRTPVLERIEKVRTGFESLLGTEKEDEARFYLAKALTLESSVHEEEENFEAAARTVREAVALLRTLTDAGHDEYRADLASALAEAAELSMYDPLDGTPTLEQALPAASEAAALFREQVSSGRPDLCADLFDIALTEAKLLFQLGRGDEALAAYNRLIDSFDSFRESTSAEMLVHLAQAHSGRANALTKFGQDQFLDVQNDLTTAIELYDHALIIEQTLPDADTDEGHERTSQLRLLQMFDRIGRGSNAVVRLADLPSAENDLRTAKETFDDLAEYLDEEKESFRDILDELAGYIADAKKDAKK